MALTFTSNDDSADIVSTAMFGGNLLFKFDSLAVSSSGFSVASNLLQVSDLRYSGGSMTELDFDVVHPDGPPLSNPQSTTYVGISDFLNFAQTRSASVTIVLPTSKMYSGVADISSNNPRAIDQAYEAEVLNYVRNLITTDDHNADSLPDVPIAAFEIGNEYWGSGQMTSREYGQVVNDLVGKMDDLFNSILGPNTAHPRVIIQMGGPWDAQFTNGFYSNETWLQKVAQANNDIISEITDSGAKAAITDLCEHYYYTPTSDGFVENSSTLNYINTDHQIWTQAGFGSCNLDITEWNVSQNNDSQFGLKSASILIEQMEYMLDLGVKNAFAWPVQGWSTSLAGPSRSSPELTPAGAAFKLMAESLVGTHAISSNITGGSLEVDAFHSATSAVFFVSSRSDQTQHVGIDFSSQVSGFSSVSGVKIGVLDGVSVDDPNSTAVISNITDQIVGHGGIVDFDLKPYEVVRIWYVLPSGKDLSGTAGSDLLSGGPGGDAVEGHRGSDSLVGALGLDTLAGGVGNDVIGGWAGSDQLFGGVGNDQLFGGSGDDLICGGPGNDKLTGGSGADTFVFNAPLSNASNVDLINDMTPSVDKISLSAADFNGLALGELLPSSFCMNSSGQAETAADRIIYNSATGALYFDQDGTGSQFQPEKFAIIAVGLHLAFSDFEVA